MAGKRKSATETRAEGLSVFRCDPRSPEHRAGCRQPCRARAVPVAEALSLGLLRRAVEGSFGSLPFGDGYSLSGADNDPYHFAMLDHDYTSDTEHAQFRQYSVVEGRWMAPDPYSGSYDPANPQSFNRYSYVLNNPLSFIDPLGLDDCTSTFDPITGRTVTTCTVNGGSDPGPPSPTPPSGPCVASGTEGCIPYPCGYPGVVCGTGSTGGNQSAPNNPGHIAGCFARGAVVGAAGALAVGLVGTAAVAVGAPVAAVTIGLGAVAAVGFGATVFTSGVDAYTGNYAGAAYGVGSLVGGLVAGAGNAANTVMGLTGETGTPLGASEAGLGIVRQPGQNWFQALVGASAKGPTQNSAALATGTAGSGLASVLNWLGGAGCH